MSLNCLVFTETGSYDFIHSVISTPNEKVVRKILAFRMVKMLHAVCFSLLHSPQKEAFLFMVSIIASVNEEL